MMVSLLPLKSLTCKVDVWSCHQRKRKCSHVLFLALTLTFFMITLQSLIPYLPKRSFAEISRPESCRNCFPTNYPNHIQPRDLCRKHQKIRLVLLVTTIPAERERRDVIRGTWCNFTSLRVREVRCVFLFGSGYVKAHQMALEEEAKQYNDILQDNYLDTYYNLSIKVIMGFRWVIRSCSQAEFIIRTAGDNYVNIPQILELLHSRSEQLSHLMAGDCHSSVWVWRWPFHRWAVTYKEYPYFYYPPYCKGTTFMVSYQLMTDIVRISSDVPFFPIEDVYFGMCLQRFRTMYRLAWVSGFSAPRLTWSDVFALGTRRKCSFGEPWFSIHDVEPLDISQIHHECKERFVSRRSDDQDHDLTLDSLDIVEFS